jgi:hypothetical protein
MLIAFADRGRTYCVTVMRSFADYDHELNY